MVDDDYYYYDDDIDVKEVKVTVNEKENEDEFVDDVVADYSVDGYYYADDL